MNLLAGDLTPTEGEQRRSHKLRVGRYAQASPGRRSGRKLGLKVLRVGQRGHRQESKSARPLQPSVLRRL